VLSPGGTITLSNGLSANLGLGDPPFVGCQMSFSFTLTSSQQP